jgi:hypothetical protein
MIGAVRLVGAVLIGLFIELTYEHEHALIACAALIAGLRLFTAGRP